MIKANGIQYPMHRFIKNPQDILQTIIKNRICPFVVVPMMIPIIKKTLPTIAGILKDTKSFIFLPDVCMNLPAREYTMIDIAIFNIVPT